MNHAMLSKSLAVGALVCGLAASAAAQQAVTVSGRVTAAGGPLAGAHVRVPSLKVDRATDDEGRYSFIVPSMSVHGQTVKMTVSMSDRRVRYASGSADLKLVGLPIIQDFDLKITSGERPTERIEEPGQERPGGGRGSGVASASPDTLNLELAGAVDLPSALAGRFAGLSVTAPGVLGGSPSLEYRGPRAILGTSQPLIVLDGVPLGNSVFASSAQRFGLGGFDYGSPIQDIDLSTISGVSLLSAPEAAAKYGGRAANGVLVATSKDGGGGPGIAVSAGQQITSETPGRLPEFQNQFGQGLDGKFQFFDGKGGGINDAVAQNWGPRLDNQPLAQASVTESGQPEVRIWSAHPAGVRDYFAAGRTLNTTIGLQGSADLGSFRASFGNRSTDGLTPSSSLSRQTGAFHAYGQPTAEMTASGWISGGQTTNRNAPGTGMNQGNPVGQFTRLGRQVDVNELRRHLVDAAGKQISWNYAGQNNPYFASLENSNRSERNHVMAGGSLALVVTPWLTATGNAGTDYFHDARRFDIHTGWMGGFPFFGAPGGGNFSRGGFESDDVFGQQTNAGLRFDGARAVPGGARWTVGVGGDVSSSRDRIRTFGVDSVANVPSAGAPDTATIPLPTSWSGHSRANAVFGETGLVFPNGATLRAGLRDEWSSIVPAQHESTLYPSLSASVDVLRALSSAPSHGSLSALTARAAWSKSAGDLTPYTIQTMYAGRTPSGTIAPVGGAALTPDSSLTPEVTNAWQFGADVSLFGRRTDVGFTVYHAQTSGVILPVPNNVVHTVVARNAGSISNSGIEGQITTRVGDGAAWLGWEISANAGKNSNSVDQLFGDVKSVDLGPSQAGLTVQARSGQPLGVLVGRRFLRDPTTHALILRAGLPLADTVRGPEQLGVAQPSWVFGLRNTVRFRWLSVSALVDGHLGGEIFSATNYWGSYTGSLSETAFRPDSGLLVAGIDAATGKANSQHVSAENYYHALGAIQEPWVYSASYFKIREVSARLVLPSSLMGGLPFSGISVAVVARNAYLWAKAPNIDPETQFTPYRFAGVELGQLPQTKSVGVQLSITP